MKIARYFIRSILVVCLIVIVLTIVRVLTPKVDVFSSVTTEWTPDLSPNAVQQITAQVTIAPIVARLQITKMYWILLNPCRSMLK